VYDPDADAVTHLQKAVDLAKQAIELDKANKYEEAVQKYISAVEFFMAAVKCTHLRHAHAHTHTHTHMDTHGYATHMPRYFVRTPARPWLHASVRLC
jgi:hypothetical protein